MKKTYRNHVSTTLNHFYEKFVLLEKMMNTNTAKKLAKHRQPVMKHFVDEL